MPGAYFFFGPLGVQRKFLDGLFTQMICQYFDRKRIDIVFFRITFAFKEVERLKSHNMKKMIDFKLFGRFCLSTDRQTNRLW